MIEYIILGAIALIGFLKYLGIFEKISFKETEIGPFKVLYVQNLGDYKKSGYKI